MEQLPRPEFHSKKEINRVGIAGVLAGVAVLITGLIVFFFDLLSPSGLGLLGIGITVVGVILILSGIDTVTSRPYRARLGAMSIRQSGSGKRYIEREAEREEQEERDRESGAAD